MDSTQQTVGETRFLKLRWTLGVICILGLMVIFIGQKQSVASWLGIVNPSWAFFIDKVTRYLLNDLFMIGLIGALFFQKKYILFALVVQIGGTFLLLGPYLWLKLVLHADNGPLVSFLHRIIVNPLLLILLLPAYYIQRQQTVGSRKEIL